MADVMDRCQLNLKQMKIKCKNIHKQNDQPDQTITTKLTAERMVPKKNTEWKPEKCI